MIDKIMDFIFKKPENWTHVRQIARGLKISPETARKSLVTLKRHGIVESRKEGNMTQFRADLENEKYRREKMLHNLRAAYSSGIVNFLHEFYRPQAIVLFGSYARGEDISSSDIDIGVITSSRKRPDLGAFERKSARRVELSLFTRKDVSEEFFANIINGIVLKGMIKNERI